jgi:hypothetical protein
MQISWLFPFRNCFGWFCAGPVSLKEADYALSLLLAGGLLQGAKEMQGKPFAKKLPG